ncbi:hypothetical protein BDM02DRAFT_3108589 [Thelephora ganbajun]|uniref:Uncharacterized protein n=1 Tax=Thelephora ganbajun TaxID=370292 RepID=A0ACB6ZTH3_THEGA|nr:hypothetical protein BDM02DRAFT_3108589 [Thelephora ganbajun]
MAQLVDFAGNNQAGSYTPGLIYHNAYVDLFHNYSGRQPASNLSSFPPPKCKGIITRVTTSRGLGQREKMSDHLPSIPIPIPFPSSIPSGHHYRQQLCNWLQPRKSKDKLSWDEQKVGPDDAPTWHAACICSFHFSPRPLDSYMQLTVDGQVYGRGEGKRLGLAKEEAAHIAYRRLLWEEVQRLINRRLSPHTP